MFFYNNQDKGGGLRKEGVSGGTIGSPEIDPPFFQTDREENKK